MNLQFDHNTTRTRDETKNLWTDSLAWWVNCLAIERYWLYAGQDLHFARRRRDALLTALVESW